jgi:hypothetical protein
MCSYVVGYIAARESKSGEECEVISQHTNHDELFDVNNSHNGIEDGAKMVTVRVDTKPAEAIP